MTREQALDAFDAIKAAGYPVTVQTHHEPRHMPDEIWRVSMGNLDHVDLKGLIDLLDENGLAARSSSLGGLAIERLADQKRRKLVG